MFPFRYSSIFRSKWIALLWAAGICITAISFVPAAKPDIDANAVADNTSITDDADLQHLQSLVNQLEQ